MPKSLKRSLVSALLPFGIVAGCIVLLYLIVLRPQQLPQQVWVPATEAFSVTDDQAIYLLPVQKQTVATPHGKALRLQNESSGLQSYQFPASTNLRAADCPNIANLESLAPSPCERIGTFQESDVYAMHRSLPSARAEYFVRIDNMFLFLIASGETRTLTVFDHFTSVPRYKLGHYLTANKQLVNEVKERQMTEAAAIAKQSREAYQHLGFDPSLPTTIPEGWETPESSGVSPFTLDGTDAKHPIMVSTYYSRDSDTIWLDVLPRQDVTLAPTCSPVHRYKAKSVTCYPLAGTRAYEAVVTEDGGGVYRYLYYPMDDSVVISMIFVVSGEDGRVTSWPTTLAKAQDTITLSAKTTSRESLENKSRFEQLFYR